MKMRKEEQHMCDYLCEIVWQRSKVNLIWNKFVAPAMARPCRPENRQHFLDVESTRGQVILAKIKIKKKIKNLFTWEE